MHYLVCRASVVPHALSGKPGGSRNLLNERLWHFLFFVPAGGTFFIFIVIFVSEAAAAVTVERAAARERQVREERPLVREESQQGRQ